MLTVLLLVVVASARAGVKAGADVPGGPDPVTVVGSAAASFPAEVLIDFDNEPVICVFRETLPLRDQYLSLGVRFRGPDALSGGAVLGSCSNFDVTGFSLTNFLAFNSLADFEGGGVPATPETLQFVGPVSAVSVLAGSAAQAGALVQLEAYNSLNALVDQNTLTLTAMLQLVGVTGPSISYVVITGPVQLVLDDLRFTPGAPVPTQSRSWARVKAAYR